MIRKLSAPLCALALGTFANAADWPQWRGPDRSGASTETGLLKEWPADKGPPLRWEARDIGNGYSSPAIAGGKVYLQTTRENEEFALALDEKTGKEVWLTKIGKVGKNMGPQYPGTRSTPTIDGNRVYCLASDGDLVCLDTAGKEKWRKSLPNELAGKVGAWAYTESVLVDGDVVVCTPGGETGLAALNKLKGEIVWKSKFPEADLADYASIMPVTTSTGKQYVQFLRKGVVGVDAKSGKFLWRYTKTIDFGANIITPVVLGNKVFTAGRPGGAVVEVSVDSDSTKIKEAYFAKSMVASIGGAVLVDGHLYASSGQLFCAEFATGKEKWNDRCVGAASICYADGRLYVRGHSGEMALVEANPEKFVEKGRFKQPNLSKIAAWPHPVVANGGLYLRDQVVLLCYEVADPKQKAK
jgi:outer membrane protein assembly factor BamB